MFEKWQESIPKITGEYMAVLLWWIDVVAPGWGTIGSSCLGDPNVIMDQVICGILQIITACCLVGWFWSVWWGALIYKKHWG